MRVQMWNWVWRFFPAEGGVRERLRGPERRLEPAEGLELRRGAERSGDGLRLTRAT